MICLFSSIEVSTRVLERTELLMRGERDVGPGSDSGWCHKEGCREHEGVRKQAVTLDAAVIWDLHYRSHRIQEINYVNLSTMDKDPRIPKCPTRG